MPNCDTILIERFAATGDAEAFAEIVHRYAGLVYSACRRITGDQARAEEAAQETFIHLLQKPQSVTGSLASWLYTAATWKAIDTVRQDAARQERETQREGPSAMSSTWDAIAPHIDQAMVSLPDQERTLVIEHFLNGKSQNDLAAEQGLSQPTISRRIEAGLKKLREQLAKCGITAASLAVLPNLLTHHMIQPAPPELIQKLGKLTLLAGTKVTSGTGSLARWLVPKLIAAALIGMAGVSIYDVGLRLRWFHPSPSRQVYSVHFTMQSPIRNNGGTNSSLSNGAYEQWYYFPEGPEGPMFLRMQRWDPKMKGKLCSWLQNESGSYYYHSGQHIVYINNYWLPMGSLRVRRLPTDPPAFTEFLDQIEGQSQGLSYTRDSKTGYLTSHTDDRVSDAPHFKSDYQYNDENPDFFRYNWSDRTKVVDERDAIHRRGWTYFRFSGRIGERSLKGVGQMPLVYRELPAHAPWLKLSIGDNRTVTDNAAGAIVRDSAGAMLAHYPPGTCFQGLLRPWMGMHTIDLIRRDAARQRVSFTTMAVPSPAAKDKAKVLIVLSRANVKLGYVVDMDRDLIDLITVMVDNEETSRITFSYPDRLDPGNEHEVPAMASDETPAAEGKGILWLFALANGTLP